MSKQVIPAEAVEAAAKFLSDCAGTGVGNWEWHVDGARELLNEVAPFIAAAAWDRAAASIVDEHGNPVIPTNVDNPYRSEQ
jgi:hypothetical protein